MSGHVMHPLLPNRAPLERLYFASVQPSHCTSLKTRIDDKKPRFESSPTKTPPMSSPKEYSEILDEEKRKLEVQTLDPSYISEGVEALLADDIRRYHELSAKKAEIKEELRHVNARLRVKCEGTQ